MKEFILPDGYNPFHDIVFGEQRDIIINPIVRISRVNRRNDKASYFDVTLSYHERRNPIVKIVTNNPLTPAFLYENLHNAMNLQAQTVLSFNEKIKQDTGIILPFS